MPEVTPICQFGTKAISFNLKGIDEKIYNLEAMGVEVIITRSDVNKGHPEYYQDVAEKIAIKKNICPRIR